MRRFIQWFVLLGVALPALVVTARRAAQAAHMGTAYVSNAVCTAAFVSHVDPDRAYRDGVAQMGPMRWIDWAVHYEIDGPRQAVTATILGAFTQASLHHAGAGCQSRFEGDPVVASTSSTPERALPPIGGADRPAPIIALGAASRRAVDAMFAASPSGDGPRTKAVVVMQRGRIVAERYGEGYGTETLLPGYSDTKSVISALIGILVHQGQLDVNAPAPIATWSAEGDPRRAITVNDLLRMQSGLEWDESLSGGPDDAARLWFMERDQAALPLSRPLAHPPGSAWQYNSGNTLVLSRLLRDAAGGTRDAFIRFAWRELFEPLGMQHVELEFDRTGTPMGGSGMSASARDWARFGLLYAEDGMAGGRRILPEGWVDFSAAPTPGAWVGYGAGFWTNRGDSLGATRRLGWGAPPRSFFASGHLGQVILIAPEEELVIARFGWSHGPHGGFAELFPQFAAVIAAVRSEENR